MQSPDLEMSVCNCLKSNIHFIAAIAFNVIQLLVFFSTSLVVLPHLHKLALANNSQSVESKRIDIATQLFEAYSALSCCCILPSVAYH